MYGITFELDAAVLEDYQLKRGVAYQKAEAALKEVGFNRVNEGLYLLTKPTNGMSFLFDIEEKLGQYEWFGASVSDFAAFKVEDWSDITKRFKGE